jgi:3-methyladenine DNA glycosylase/8-oxoguanine DNA glycosylase
MRIGERDAFPADDPRLRRGLTALDPTAAGEAAEVAEAVRAAEAWRPWRALAATHLIAHGEAQR